MRHNTRRAMTCLGRSWPLRFRPSRSRLSRFRFSTSGPSRFGARDRRLVAATALACWLPLVMAIDARAQQPLPDGWGYMALTSHWQVSAMFDGQVYSSDGRPVGRVHDLVFDREGRLQKVVVEPESRDGSGFVAVDWGESRFSSAVGSLTLTVPVADIEALEHRDRPDFVESAAGAGMEASNVMGMLVNLPGQPRWGQVSDLLIASSDFTVSALVVESLGPGRLQYALPAAGWEKLDYEGHQLDLPYSIEAIEALGRWSSSQLSR